jgi:sugar lactone lactonase YvrE
MHADQLTAPITQHGEGPAWITGSRWPDGLYFVDMLAGDVLHLAADGSIERRHVGAVAAVIRPRTNGGLLYAVERGFALDAGPDSSLRLLPDVFDDPTLRMNEGGCAPDGSFYCGTMSYQQVPGAGTLYRLAVDGTVTIVEEGLTIPNGLEWLPDGSRAFHNDTPTGRIDVLDWDLEQGLHDRRPFARVEGGGPDGLTLDAEGGVWVAVWGGSAVHRYAPDGSLSVVIEVPAAQVSACTFGGANRDELFITTSREGLADPEPGAGAVFVSRPGVAGLPVRPYAG